MPRGNDVEDQRSLCTTHSIHAGPDTINKLVKRLRALTLRLLPVEVEEEEITGASSSIVSPEVVDVYEEAGGDFREAIPFWPSVRCLLRLDDSKDAYAPRKALELCLLRARKMFVEDANANPTDYGENMCRATACEVLARKSVHRMPAHRLQSVMSTRYRYRERDGDASAPTCALETAIDQHCTIFLSSSEAQMVVTMLWTGEWVQHNNDNDDIDYVEYVPDHDNPHSFWAHMDPSRMGVPRYQTWFRIIIWFFFLFVYSQTVQSPLDSVDPLREFTAWEIILYVMSFAFFIEETVKVTKTMRISNSFFGVFNFWNIVNLLTAILLLTSLALRIAGINHANDSKERAHLHLLSFQFLACAAPAVWLRTLVTLEGFKVVGVLQVVVFRMLRESAIFFILLGIMGIGFAQSLYALDAADGDTGEDGSSLWLIINSLIQSLLGGADFDTASQRFGYPFGLIIFYFWNFFAIIILVNVLIALFGTAYSEVYDNAVDEFITFFSGKTVDMIRAPDVFVYPAPFNLIEAFLVAPWEFVLSKSQYVALNRFVMRIVFCAPLTLIALFESQVLHSRGGVGGYIHDYFAEPAPEDDEDPDTLDPKGDDEGEICTVRFDELAKRLPNTTVSNSTLILGQLKDMRKNLDTFERQVRSGSVEVKSE